MSAPVTRVSYHQLERNLEDDDRFPSEALRILREVDPLSTYTVASSPAALLNRWTVYRDLTVYFRGRPVDDVTDVSLYRDVDGGLERALESVERDWQIDTAELVGLFKQLGMTVPTFLAMPESSEDTDDRVAIGGQMVKRAGLIAKLSDRFPQFETALRTNDAAFKQCRVPTSHSPGKVRGYYYLNQVEAVCAARWLTGTQPGTIPRMQSLGSWTQSLPVGQPRKKARKKLVKD